MFLSSNAKTPRFIGSAPVLCEYCGNFLLERNIVRIFANNDNGYDEKGLYGPGGTNCPLCQGDGASGADGYSAIPCQAGQLLFGDIHEVLPIAKATVSQHLKELKEAGLIQGEIETPKVRYCINRANWTVARNLFVGFFCDCKDKDSCCG